MKVKVTYLNCEPTRERRDWEETDCIQARKDHLLVVDARQVMEFDADSIFDICLKLVEELFIDNDDSVESLDDLKNFLESNNKDDPYNDNDWIETVTINGKLVFKDAHIKDIIDGINKDFFEKYRKI